MEKIKLWYYKFLGKLLLDYSHKKLIKLNNEDPLFHKFVSNFKGKIIISTENNEIKRSLIFNGNGNIKYIKKRVNEPDASLIFNSIKDLYKFFRNYGDVYEGMLENRFKIRGNSNILFKYQFLTNYFNPKKKKIPISL
jgi:hypothetical protein